MLDSLLYGSKIGMYQCLSCPEQVSDRRRDDASKPCGSAPGAARADFIALVFVTVEEDCDTTCRPSTLPTRSAVLRN